MADVRKQRMRAHKVFWKILCKLHDHFFRTQEVENQIFQKTLLLTFWPIFSRNIRCDKLQETIYKGPQAIFTVTVEPIRAFFQDIRGCCKYKLLKKRQSFQCRKNFGPSFSFFGTSETSRYNLKGSTMFFDNHWANDKINSLGPERSTDTNISKISCFHNDKNFWLNFIRIIKCDKPSGT